MYNNIQNYLYLQGLKCLGVVSLFRLHWKKRKKTDGNLLVPNDGFPKAVPLILSS